MPKTGPRLASSGPAPQGSGLQPRRPDVGPLVCPPSPMAFLWEPRVRDRLPRPASTPAFLFVFVPHLPSPRQATRLTRGLPNCLPGHATTTPRWPLRRVTGRVAFSQLSGIPAVPFLPRGFSLQAGRSMPLPTVAACPPRAQPPAVEKRTGDKAAVERQVASVPARPCPAACWVVLRRGVRPRGQKAGRFPCAEKGLPPGVPPEVRRLTYGASRSFGHPAGSRPWRDAAGTSS